MDDHLILNQLYNFNLKDRQLGIVWLGQSGFLIKSKSAVFLIDPYLSDFAEQWTFGKHNEHIRMHPAPIAPKEIYGVDVVLCTHDHVDHIDPYSIPVLALRNPQTRFVAPLTAKNRILGLYVDESRLDVLSGLDSLEKGPVSVHAIPAAHSQLDYDKENGYPYLSYVIKVDGLTIFHAGDTVPYDKQAEYLSTFNIDVALLPVNGEKDPSLDLLPNFNIHQAVQFAQDINAKLTIPMHYDMFTINTIDINDFKMAAKDKINFQIVKLGEPLVLSL